MNLLLDTHIFIWWLEDSPKLSLVARKAITEPTKLIFVSAATIWEIIIKKAVGKLDCPDDLAEAMRANRFQHLPITFLHALAVGNLPLLHVDPFDRMLVAQAQSEGLTIVTVDDKVKQYGIACLKL